MEDSVIPPCWVRIGGTSPQARFCGRQCGVRCLDRGNEHQDQAHLDPMQPWVPTLAWPLPQGLCESSGL